MEPWSCSISMRWCYPQTKLQDLQRLRDILLLLVCIAAWSQFRSYPLCSMPYSSSWIPTTEYNTFSCATHAINGSKYAVWAVLYGYRVQRVSVDFFCICVWASHPYETEATCFPRRHPENTTQGCSWKITRITPLVPWSWIVWRNIYFIAMGSLNLKHRKGILLQKFRSRVWLSAARTSDTDRSGLPQDKKGNDLGTK